MADKVKHIPEQKLKAFSIGTMGKRALSKREIEEQRRKEQEEAAAHAFQEFVETFQDSPINGSKVWVKAGTYDAGARKEDTRERGKLYKPQSRMGQNENLSSSERAQEYARLLAGDRKPERLGKKKPLSKSNLESFKEELRQIQEEREERHKYKGVMRTPVESELDVFVKIGDNGSFDNGDPTTTNLYLGNLNPKITEQQLMEVFGRYGPLASIKIMWPRSDEEKARGRNCGFVAYMSRKDGERALRNLNGKDVLGYEMKLGWGKSVVIPPHPIYIPPALMELSMPPPPSGLPFNAQPCPKDREALPQTADELNLILSRAVVKVVIPTDRNLIMLIHRMVEFVIREGPMFEAMIMNKEINNPLFRFLFENQSPAHVYYRWKLFSLLNGDSQKEWNNRELRLFKGGSIWKPPVINCYTAGMPPELTVDDDSKEPIKGSLSNTQRDRLEDLIRNLTPEVKRIGEVMVFCIEHSDAADEIAECLTESLTNMHTMITKKIARLYLISDILYNCGVKVNKASFYRRAFEIRLLDIMRNVRETVNNLESRLKAEGFKMRVLRILKAWEDSIYPREFMTNLNNTFLGLEGISDNEEEIDQAALSHDHDGAPLEEELETDEDAPMDGAALLKGAMKMIQSSPVSGGDDDVDGIPVDGAPLSAVSGFIPSKWETVDPDQIEAQAMTTSKWDQLENSGEDSQESQPENQDSSECNDARDMTEERRTKLREIEVKAVQYQDELESGQRMLKTGWTISQQVEHYRRKLLKKSEKEKRGNSKDKHRSRERKQLKEDSSGDEAYSYKEVTSSSRKNKKHARSSSGSSTKSKYRSKSRSPPRKKSSRALTPPSPPRIRRHSPKSSKYNKSSLSPSRKSYDSPSSNGKVSSPRSTSKIKGHTPSPPPSRPPKHSRRSASPRRDSPRSKHKTTSPDVSRKHRHKHKY